MVRGVSRRAVLGLLAATAADAALAAPATSLRPVLRPTGPAARRAPSADAIIAEARLGGRVCYAVADARSGQLLEGGNAKTGMPPASVAKAITALYALEALGPTHRFETQVVATGAVADGVVQGDLVLVGGADPTLDTNALAALAQAVKEAGIREVRGGFKVAEGILPFTRTIDRDQPDHVGYSPAVSGIALNFNRVHFEWRRSGNGYAVTMDARTDRYRPAVYTSKMQVVNRDLPVYSYSDGGRVDQWTVSRRALGNGGARWLPVRNPALYAGDVFQTLARSQGIVLKAPEAVNRTPAGRTLAVHRSVALQTILRDMLRFSNNLTAEMVGMAATRAMDGRAGSLKGSAQAMSRWASATLGASGTRLVDHSGLGGASNMTADGMVRALAKAYHAAQLQPILRAFPMRDAQRRIIRDHPVDVAAKTGTLNFVSGLGGYMTTRDGRDLAFAILAADEETRARISRANRESPQGARSWNTRAKIMQQKLIERWDALYTA